MWGKKTLTIPSWGQTMSTRSAAAACSASQRIGPNSAIFPCCHMSTATLQPPCCCRNSAKATTTPWKTGFSAGYTMRTGIGATGEVCDNLEPHNLPKLLSGKKRGKADVGCLQGQVSMLYRVSNEFLEIPKLKLTWAQYFRHIPYICTKEVLLSSCNELSIPTHYHWFCFLCVLSIMFVWEVLYLQIK